VIDGSPPDPDCNLVEPPVKRLILTPYADMDATFAATAWRHTWTSKCTTFTASDREALLDFIEEHWGSNGDAGGEDTVCSPGSITP
jgi:hypothetical protein